MALLVATHTDKTGFDTKRTEKIIGNLRSELIDEFGDSFFIPRAFATALDNGNSYAELRVAVERLAAQQEGAVHRVPRAHVLLESLVNEYRDELIEKNVPMVVLERLEKIGSLFVLVCSEAFIMNSRCKCRP